MSVNKKTIFSMIDLSKTVDNKRDILKEIYISFYYGAKIGVLGINGSGKSTLLKIIAGIDTNYSGEITYQKGLKFGYLPQEPKLDTTKDVRGNVEDAVRATKDLLKEFDEINLKFAEPMSDDEMNALIARQGELSELIESSDAWNLDRKLDIAADALRLPAWDADVSTLSGGECRRVALCKLLLSTPDVLLLDEPTNHLDAESVAWLEEYLAKFEGTVIAVTHDRYFLDNVAGWILELDRGRGIPYEGNYTGWLEQKEARLIQEKRTEDAHARAMKTELEWVRSNAKGGRTKNKARLKDYDILSSVEFQQRNETQEIYIPPGPRLGDDVLEVQGVSKRLGNKLLFENLSFKVPKGAIVGIIGPNGAGKSTLFKLIAGLEQPDAGSIHLGKTVELAYVNQSRDTLNADKTIFEEISDGLDFITVGKYSTPSRTYVGRFNFKGAEQQKYIGNLSGGERNRVHLAKLLRKGGNFLLLDEPTNDLDVETLRSLEDALTTYPGCAMVISHDRWFLDRICTHILAYEGDSVVRYFEGNYTEYEQDRKERTGETGSEHPHRVRFKDISVD